MTYSNPRRFVSKPPKGFWRKRDDGEDRIYKSKDGQLISNIISTMSREMGVMLEDQKLYIVSNVLTDLNEQLDDEETYEKKRAINCTREIAYNNIHTRRCIVTMGW